MKICLVQPSQLHPISEHVVVEGGGGVVVVIKQYNMAEYDGFNVANFYVRSLLFRLVAEPILCTMRIRQNSAQLS